MSETSRWRPRPLGYCLDANLSHKVAIALRTVEWNVIHVSDVPTLNPEPPRFEGQCQASDKEIVEWCTADGRIVVTQDNDFTGRGVEAEAFRANGLEVIWYSEQIEGLAEQHRRITHDITGWERRLNEVGPGARVWIQYKKRNDPVLRDGKRKKPRRGSFTR